jgi:hypothetical protein
MAKRLAKMLDARAANAATTQAKKVAAQAKKSTTPSIIE